MNKNLLSLFLFSILTLTLNAQSNWLSAINAGDFDDDRGTSIAKDDSGNVYVTGYFASPTIVFGSITLTNTSPGSYDIFIVKYTPAGTVQWAKRAGGSGFDYVNSVSIDTNNDVYISGNFRSPTIVFGTTTLTNAGVSYDIYIAKYTKGGVPVWAKRSGGTNDETCTTVVADAGGNVLITGFFTSASIVFGTTTLTNAQNNNADMFVAKYDGLGTVLWAKRAGSINGEYGYGMCTDAANNVYVTGSFGSNTLTIGTTTLTNANVNATQDIYVVKYNSAGTVQWAKRFGGTDDDIANCINTDVNGYLYLCGYFGSPNIDFGVGPMTTNGFWDVFITKLDQVGNTQWSKGAGSTGFDFCKAVTSDASGNVFATGYFDTPGITFGTSTLNSAGGYDVFAVGYTAAGNFILADRAGSTFTDEGDALCFDSFGNLMVTGSYTSPTIAFGLTTLTNVGGNDVFISHLSSVNLIFTAVDQTSLNADGINVYPNPSTGIFNVSSNEEISMIEVFDVVGSKVLSQQISIPIAIGTTNSPIDLSNQAKGIYFVRINTSEGTVVKKVVKE